MASKVFGSSVKRKEDPRLLTGQAKFTDDFTLPGMAHLAVVRSPVRARAHQGHPDEEGRRDRGRPRRLHRQGHEGGRLRPDPLRVGRPRLRREDAAVSADRDRRRPLRGQRRRDRRGDRSLRGARRRRGRRGRLRAAAGRRRREEGDREGTPAAPPGRAEQPRLHVEGRGRQRGCRLQVGRRGRLRADHQPAPDPERDGDARGARRVPVGDRRGHALGDVPEPAHRPLPALARHRHPREQDPRHRARGGRRLRQQDPALPRGHDGDLRVEAVRLPGQVGRDAVRELPRHDPRPRPHPGRRDGREEGRHHRRHPRHGVGQHGRVPLDRVDRHSDDPARPDALGRVRHPEHPARSSTGSSRTRRRRTPTVAPGGPRRPSWSSGWSISSQGS